MRSLCFGLVTLVATVLLSGAVQAQVIATCDQRMSGVLDLPPAGDLKHDVNEVRRKAQRGSAARQNELGLRFALGLDLPRISDEAVVWFRRAADAGYAPALVNLALVLDCRGEDKERDRLLRAAARQSDGRAFYLLSQHIDEPRALEKAASLGYDRAVLEFAERYRGSPADQGKVERVLKRAADRGSAEARARLGLLTGGRGPVWRGAEEAAKAGNVEAMLGLANLADDDPMARSWRLKAAEGGSVEGMLALAEMLEAGEGGPVDLAGALAWRLKAETRGSTAAAYELGRMYESGLGVPKDELKAVRLLMVAAQDFSPSDEPAYSEPRNPEAAGRLAAMYLEGRGVPADPREALRWVTGRPNELPLMYRLLDKARSDGDLFWAAQVWAEISEASEARAPESPELKKAVAALKPPADAGQSAARVTLALVAKVAPDLTAGLIAPEQIVPWLEVGARSGDNRAALLLVDPSKRPAWLERAAQLGDPEAMFQLSESLKYEGPGAAAERLQLLERIAAVRPALAAAKVGHAYLVGEGAPADPVKAKIWLERAKATGGEEGAADYARLLRNTNAPDAEWEGVIAWLRQAAAGRDDDAANLLGEITERGAQTWQDQAWAAHWYAEGALGDAAAARNLARCLSKGIGVTRDDRAASRWRARAVEIEKQAREEAAG